MLVLGGYGNFGQTICLLLAQDADIRLLIGGRDGARAADFAASFDNKVTGIAIDAQAVDLAGRLQNLGVDTLIQTAGPFQGQNYAVAEACINARCNYIDLADGRDFVDGISSLDARANAAGVLVTSGASSVPALTSAVVDHFLSEFKELHEIRHGISAGGHTPGLATMQGVLGYCGKPFLRLENGEWVTTYGWQDLHRYRYAAPVGSRWLGSCDVPDLEIFPKRYPDVRSVVFHAGVGNPVSHLSTWAISGLVRVGLLNSLAPLAPAFRRVNRWLEPVSPDVSAVHVEMRGIGLDGKAHSRIWQLIAFDNHGPQIPCGAAVALARKLAAGKVGVKGAGPCVGLLTLEEYLGALAHLHIKQVML
ncbi:MAG: saccharopine dehydrogenase [Zetaproteobacteria bacterium CG12_big_fil_rev_8_21_14_0_65_55_1124]|nr:MAG: saccharopine dehydrogenase [Zetaproteobacteria bacterium CG08_land_8_20_14_0_20_55_17]PIW41938.1 MAG: saccharopine dehydrogenase [Zetaproteobacteria bacterium CG12_big_fil_rev_8_21_14_0_65_55_1124]PIY53557.1 MAG: saccharopine dehydrogenase [Zetaproteobacteria bacterium CG_4_10_14_0_8_um_filter_55_43]PIZ37426.1 MAG: saccharopine dehydrogenase [Zetaproteobacteria bacterium CG_4_10_14_0_2_um_filter_55_20]PJB81640.1 MAG: saccharopine dehydrogenase [Zetaproteobacteria bacterium CG_4_9_14_0_8